jgi:hypothetical protein
MVSLRKKCPEEISEFAELYLLQRLSEEDSGEFEEHLLGCSRCMDAVEDAEQFLTAFRGANGRVGAELPLCAREIAFRPGFAGTHSTV